MDARADLATALQLRASAAGFLINLAGGLSLAVYMLVVYPVRGEDSLLLEQGVGLGAVALFNVVAGLSAYRTASPWWASMRAWLAAGGPPAARAVPGGAGAAEALRAHDRRPLAARDRRLRRRRADGLAVVRDRGHGRDRAGRPDGDGGRLPGDRVGGAARRRARARARGAARRALARDRAAAAADVAAVLRRADPDARARADRPRRAGPATPDRPDAVRRRDGARDRLRRDQARHAVGDQPDPGAAPRGRRRRRRRPRRRVQVNDGSEVGRLQAGFNAMVGGLRERERMRDLFGPPGRPRRRPRGARAAAPSSAAGARRSPRSSSTSSARPRSPSARRPSAWSRCSTTSSPRWWTSSTPTAGS